MIQGIFYAAGKGLRIIGSSIIGTAQDAVNGALSIGMSLILTIAKNAAIGLGCIIGVVLLTKLFICIIKKGFWRIQEGRYSKDALQ